jgi:MinD-like ATPase involved in chromosome partitioning or flagellar assembly
MPSERWVLIGLAQARSAWFRDVAQWTTSATIAAEFVKCVSSEEVRARLASGRAYSALLVDASLASFDRDLVATAIAAYTPVIAVTDGRGRAWSPDDLGVVAVLPAGFDRRQLVEVLEASARTIGRGDLLPPLLAEPAPPPWRGRLLAVCGPGGTGSSTVAIALAQGLAADVRFGGRVLLADLALRADQSMLHDAGELGPGLQELVEAHRLGHPEPGEVRSYTFDVAARGYRLLLGLRRPAAWSALRPRATDAAIDALRRAFQLVVADISGDLEGEVDSGSIDVEERNHLARSSVLQADVTLVVGSPGLKGVHSVAGVVRSLAAAGVDPARVLTVINRAPRTPRARAEISAAISRGSPVTALATPVWLPERKLDEALRDGVALPLPVVRPLTDAALALLERLADAVPPTVGPARITPGSLGTWTGDGIETGG